MSAGSHGVSVHLGFDVDGLNGVFLQPSDVNFDIKVTDAVSNVSAEMSTRFATCLPQGSI